MQLMYVNVRNLYVKGKSGIAAYHLAKARFCGLYKVIGVVGI